MQKKEQLKKYKKVIVKDEGVDRIFFVDKSTKHIPGILISENRETTRHNFSLMTKLGIKIEAPKGGAMTVKTTIWDNYGIVFCLTDKGTKKVIFMHREFKEEYLVLLKDSVILPGLDSTFDKMYKALRESNPEKIKEILDAVL